RLSSSTGAVSGTPSAAGASMLYTITVMDQNGATATGSFTLAVNQTGSSAAKITVTPSSATVTDQQPPTLAVTVSGSGVTPTGVLTFSTGPAFVQQPLAGGKASFTVPSTMLTGGANALTVYYSGDATYSAGSGQTTVVEYPVVLTVPSMPTIAHGSSGSVTATVSAGSGYASTINLTCILTSAPQSAQVVPTCSVSPTGVALTKGATGSATLTVNASTPSLFTQAKPHITSRWPLACASLLGTLGLLLAPGKRRRLPALLMLLAMTLGLTAVTGCGTGVYTQYLPATGAATPGSYTFTVSGVDSKTPTITTNVATLTVTIQ
ncbi:MAG: hypothetical protein JWP44_4588, partial [Mucilaginibacter sp.]|nr:hypothetical protein [Mucilaginibacter sp.]